MGDKEKFIKLANTNFNKEDVFLKVTYKKSSKKEKNYPHKRDSWWVIGDCINLYFKGDIKLRKKGGDYGRFKKW